MVHSVEQANLTDEQKQIVLQSHIVIATPCYGGMISASSFHSILDFAGFWGKCGLNWTVETLTNESLVSRARNHLVARMMARPEATHLMFVDADIGFQTPDIIRMLAHDVEVVAGIYPKKGYPIEFVLNTLPDQLTRQAEIAEVFEIGTGFMLIKRAVLERMMQAYPDFRCHNLDGLPAEAEPFYYSLFDTDLQKGVYLSEDYTFCRRWRKLGGRIYADTRIKLTHTGTHTFAGDPRDHLPFVD